MPGNRVAKVLDLECPLQAGGEEAAEGCYERGEGSEDEDVELDGHNVECARDGYTSRDERQCVVSCNEDWIRLAFEAGPNVCAEVLRLLV